MNLDKYIKELAAKTKKASREVASLKENTKNKILREMAKELLKSKNYILKQNVKDIKRAKKLKLSDSMIDRLSLTDKRIQSMATSIKDIATLPDPTGSVEDIVKRPNGLLIGKMKVPIGVIFVIYESRPNVTADCMALCLKSGNALILRGGSEAINSNIAIFDILMKKAVKAGLPENSINLIKVTDRKAVDKLLKLSNFVDLVIPRGGESLIREVTKQSRIPVIQHYKGVCHVFVDDYADLNMALNIVFNAKVQRPGVCNAMETLLVHKDVAVRFLPSIAKKLKEASVELRGCPLTRRILKGVKVKAATEKDWTTEYLDLILSIKVVGSLEEAMDHINTYGTYHSDAIVTDNYKNALEFLQKVDSSTVYVNASTRFTDGHEFGKGAEIGISTNKLHARGPMGLEELTTYKYIVLGEGQIRV